MRIPKLIRSNQNAKLFSHPAENNRLNHSDRLMRVPVIRPIIIDTVYHDPEAFTQGLIYRQGFLYESTGLYRKSSLRKITMDGKIIANLPVTEGFAEGLACYKNELIQLTWNEKIAIRYSLPGLNKLGNFRYKGQGWGLTCNSHAFIMSDGSCNLYLRDDKFAVMGKIVVTLDGRPINRLNDLEFVNDRIYANVWCSDFLLEIDFYTGQVLRIVDCSKIISLEAPDDMEKVLNGIAYCSELDVFYITGKKWSRYFLMKIPWQNESLSHK